MAIEMQVTDVHHIGATEKKELKKEVESAAFKQLEKQAKTVFNRVNKRIRNIESNKKVISPAYNALKKKRGDAPRFGTSGTYSNIKSLQKELSQALAFDNMETSTVQGARNYTENLRSQVGGDLTDTAINLIFDSLHALHERVPDSLYGNLLQYRDYLDTIVEVQENTDFSSFTDFQSQVDEVVTQAINKLTDQLTDTINDGIDYLANGFDRLF